jgi:hypothetical protein
VNWKPETPVIISPSLSKVQAEERHPQGYKDLKRYCRIVELP